MNSSLNGNSRAVKILLSKGANVEITEDNGYAALHLAATGGHLAVTKMLVEAAADLVEGKTYDGCTPLHLAAGNGHCGVLRMMIGAGANPNSRMSRGETPLYLAAENGQLVGGGEGALPRESRRLVGQDGSRRAYIHAN